MTAGGLLALIEGAWRAVPAIEELPIAETWVGFRPGSRDDAPMLGPSGIDGLVVATGHHRNGILLDAGDRRVDQRLYFDRPVPESASRSPRNASWTIDACRRRGRTSSAAWKRDDAAADQRRRGGSRGDDGRRTAGRSRHRPGRAVSRRCGQRQRGAPRRRMALQRACARRHRRDRAARSRAAEVAQTVFRISSR